MTWQKIQVNSPLWSNIEDESRSVVSEERMDVMKDSAGSTKRRPGLYVFNNDLSSVVDGLYYWPTTDLVYLVSNTSLYSLSKAGALTLIQSGLFNPSFSHVSWTEANDLTLVTAGAINSIFACNKSKIVHYNGTTAEKLNTDNVPMLATHISIFDTYMLSNEVSDSKWYESIKYSKVADPLTWEGSYFSAENHPDRLQALHTEWDEIALFGSKSIEHYYNDGATPFSPIPGANISEDGGTLSPWTIKKAANAYFLLNGKRRVIRVDGRNPTDISASIGDILQGDVDYENAEGNTFHLNNRDYYLLTINERTFVYDTLLNEWVSEWGYWNKASSKYVRFKGRNFLTVSEWGITLCTDPYNGNIYVFDEDTYTDNENEIRSSVITGLIDHNTGREKRSNELRIRLKRGYKTKTTTTDIEPKMLVRWRDNGSKVWSNYREVFLGFDGENEIYYSLFQLGSYRSRQWNFVVSDDVPFSIVEVEEDVELLR